MNSSIFVEFCVSFNKVGTLPGSSAITTVCFSTANPNVSLMDAYNVWLPGGSINE